MSLITLDGNIGSGKSSILNYLHKYHKISIDLEPVDKWHKYLLNLYKNNSNVFKFYVRIWLDRCWIQEKAENVPIIIERSPYFIKNTFINKAYELNLLSENEYNILLELHNKTDPFWVNNRYIYLYSNPEKCFQRVKKRNRLCESKITQEYINEIHDSHELEYINAVNNGMDIHKIDIEDKHISEIVKEILDIIFVS